jgi:hypothetical protein
MSRGGIGGSGGCVAHAHTMRSPGERLASYGAHTGLATGPRAAGREIGREWNRPNPANHPKLLRNRAAERTTAAYRYSLAPRGCPETCVEWSRFSTAFVASLRTAVS